MSKSRDAQATVGTDCPQLVVQTMITVDAQSACQLAVDSRKNFVAQYAALGPLCASVCGLDAQVATCVLDATYMKAFAASNPNASPGDAAGIVCPDEPDGSTIALDCDITVGTGTSGCAL